MGSAGGGTIAAVTASARADAFEARLSYMDMLLLQGFVMAVLPNTGGAAASDDSGSEAGDTPPAGEKDEVTIFDSYTFDSYMNASGQRTESRFLIEKRYTSSRSSGILSTVALSTVIYSLTLKHA
jgi:hypothetical protein